MACLILGIPGAKKQLQFWRTSLAIADLETIQGLHQIGAVECTNYPEMTISIGT